MATAVKQIEPITDYMVGDSAWRVGWPQEFARRFVLSRETAGQFHAWAESRTDLVVSWRICRMLNGLVPVIPAEGSNPDFYEEDMTIPIICERLKIEPPEVEMELDLLARSWFHYQSKQAQIEDQKAAQEAAVEALKPLPAPPLNQPPPVILGQTEYSDEPLTVTQQALLKKRGFDIEDFKAEKGRSAAKRNQEMQWFHGQLVEQQRILDDPNGKERIRQVLINQLYIRRIDEKLMKVGQDDDGVDKLMQRKQALEEMVIKQLVEIEKVCPFARSAINKITAVGAISEIIQGLRDFEAHGDNRLRDGIFTAYEILVMDRESQQQHSAYRPGWVAHMIEAAAGLFDPAFKNTIPIGVSQTMDMSWLIAKKTINEKLGIQVPNLLSDGADGEYPDLPELTESATIDIAEETGKLTLDEEVTAPLVSVNLDDNQNANLAHGATLAAR